MEIAVNRGVVAAFDRKAGQKMATERQRQRARRDGPATTQQASGVPWFKQMAARFPSAVVTDVERVH